MARAVKNSGRKSFLLNIIWAIILIFALVLLLRIALSIFTQHNREIDVPDFSGMVIEDAEHLADKSHVRLDVTDSVFVTRLGLGTVFSQNPAPGSKVKKGRRILITINATQPKTVEMPSLVGLSLRAAKQRIVASGLTVGHLDYVYDMATNNVLAQSVNGRRVEPGRKLKLDTPIDLTLGRNSSDGVTYIPYVVGMTFPMACEELIDNSLNRGTIIYDDSVKTYADSLQAVVYSQSPVYSGDNNAFLLGTPVSLWLTVDQSKLKNQ